mgnify:CR=1 FL=1
MAFRAFQRVTKILLLPVLVGNNVVLALSRTSAPVRWFTFKSRFRNGPFWMTISPCEVTFSISPVDLLKGISKPFPFNFRYPSVSSTISFKLPEAFRYSGRTGFPMAISSASISRSSASKNSSRKLFPFSQPEPHAQHTLSCGFRSGRVTSKVCPL